MTTRAFATSMIILLMMQASLAVAGSSSDLKKEARFHEIYQQYNVEPTSSEKWQSAVTEAQTKNPNEIYDVQKGDTLWDISDTLFADAEFWPKVWALNVEKIGNPHEIEVGQQIQFTPGTAAEPPQLAMTDKATDEKTSGMGNATNHVVDEKPQRIKFDLGKVQIPAPLHPQRPVTDLPNSLPAWDYRGAPTEVIDLDLKSPRTRFGHPPETLSAYISDAELASIGKVTEVEAGYDAAAEYQYIVVQLPNKPAEKKLLVVKEAGKLKDPATDEMGHVVHIQGEIEVLAPVNAEQNLYRAMVTKSVDLVEIGSDVIVGSIPVYDTTANNVVKSASDAMIIGGADGMDRKIFGGHSIVFLNGGSGKGMVPGAVYPIYKNQSLRTEDTQEVQNPLQIGHVKILRVGNNFATAVITDVKDELQVGDTTAPVAHR